MPIFAKGVPKSQKAAKGDFWVHPINDKDLDVNNLDFDNIVIYSIDPGRVNLGVRVEKRVGGVITTLKFENISFKSEVDKKIPRVDQTYGLFLDYLDDNRDILINVDIILIERQREVNYKMVRLSQCLIDWYLINCRRSEVGRLLIEIDSNLKYRKLGVPKNLNDSGKKLWGTELAISMLTITKNVKDLELINSVKKKNDLADIYIQIRAFEVALGHEPEDFRLMRLIEDESDEDDMFMDALPPPKAPTGTKTRPKIKFDLAVDEELDADKIVNSIISEAALEDHLDSFSSKKKRRKKHKKDKK